MVQTRYTLNSGGVDYRKVQLLVCRPQPVEQPKDKDKPKAEPVKTKPKSSCAAAGTASFAGLAVALLLIFGWMRRRS